VKFGRNRPVAIGPHFRLHNYLRAALPGPPPSVDYSAPAVSILSDIMGNDQLGDCVIAWGYHFVGTETANAGDPFHATMAQVIADYGSIGGYVPGQPQTDQGCDEITALNFWQQTGFANGTKLSGWLTVDATNKSEVMSAIQLFGAVFLTLELPDTYTNPFPSSSGFVWDVGTPDPNQGHAIGAVGYDGVGVKIATWGMLGTMTWAALAALCTAQAGGGCYVALTPDAMAKGAATSFTGVAWSDLISDFDSMGGSVPAPPPAPAPAPPPDPSAPVTLAEAQGWTVAALQSSFPLMTRSQAEATVRAALAANWRGT
jgi:hypothetical protein